MEHQFIIDPEFESIIPPLSEDEFRQLKENILHDGEIRHALVIWNAILVDGHHRYKILQENPDLKYHIEEKNFSNRAEAIAWICANQLGRRNLSLLQKTALMGRRYAAEHEAHGDTERFHGSPCTQNEGMGKNKTANRLAAEYGVSHATIQRAKMFVGGMDAAGMSSPGISREILSGELKVTQADVIAIGKAPKEQQAEMTASLRAPKRLTEEQKKAREKSRVFNRDLDALYAEHIREDKPKPTAWNMISSLSADVDLAIGNMQDYFKNYPDMLFDHELQEKTMEIFGRLRDFMTRSEVMMKKAKTDT